jgi:hypothetical protein
MTCFTVFLEEEIPFMQGKEIHAVVTSDSEFEFFLQLKITGGKINPLKTLYILFLYFIQADHVALK